MSSPCCLTPGELIHNNQVPVAYAVPSAERGRQPALPPHQPDSSFTGQPCAEDSLYYEILERLPYRFLRERTLSQAGSHGPVMHPMACGSEAQLTDAEGAQVSCFAKSPPRRAQPRDEAALKGATTSKNDSCSGHSLNTPCCCSCAGLARHAFTTTRAAVRHADGRTDVG